MKHRTAPPPLPWTIHIYVPIGDADRIISNHAADRIDHPRGGCPLPQGEIEEARASRTERTGELDFRPCAEGNLRRVAADRASRLDRNWRRDRHSSRQALRGKNDIRDFREACPPGRF